MRLRENRFLDFITVNNSDSNMAVKDYELADARNVTLSTAGTVTKRPGYGATYTLPTDSVIVGAYQNGIVLQNAESLNYHDFNDDITTKIVDLTTIDTVVSAYCPADDKLYLVSPSFALASWDGTTLTTVTPTLYANMIYWWHNHMFAGGKLNFNNQTFSDQRMLISNLGDPTTWSSTDWVPADGEGEIVAMASLGDEGLVIGKTRSTFVTFGYGEESWALGSGADPGKNIDNSTGCAGPYAMIRVANEVWFVDHAGQLRVFYQTDSDAYRKTYRSEKIPKWLEEVNLSNLSHARITYTDNKVFYLAPTVSGEFSCLVFDLLASRRAPLKTDGSMGESWTRFDYEEKKLNSIINLWQGQVAMPFLCFGDVGAFYGGDSDNNNKIEAYATLANSDFGKFSQIKKYVVFFCVAEILSESDEASLSISVDNRPFVSVGQFTSTSSGGTLCNGNDDEFELVFNPSTGEYDEIQTVFATPTTTGTFILDSDVTGITPTANNMLSDDNPLFTKLFYEDSGDLAYGKVIQHKLELIGDQPVRIGKVSSNYKIKEVG